MYSEIDTLDAPRDASVLLAPTRLASGRAKTKKKVGLAPVTAQRESENLRWTECIVRIRDRKDEAAFAELFDHFAPRIKAFLMRSGGDATIAEECAQHVMATLWQKAHLFDPSRASAATWIFTIARNQIGRAHV